MEKTSVTIEAYLKTLDFKDQEVMQKLIDLVYRVNPGMEYAVWHGEFWGGGKQTILGFGEYVYETKSGVSGTWFKIGLARQKAYYSLYVTAIKEGKNSTKEYQGRLGKVKMGASSISFTKLENVNLENLEKLFADAAAAS